MAGDDTKQLIDNHEQKIARIDVNTQALSIKQAVQQEKLNNIEAATTRIEAAVTTGFKEMNGRVKRLELWRSYLLGGMAVIVFGLPILIKVLFL